MKHRPKIGVTGPDRGGFPAWIFTRLAIRRAGGHAIRLRPGRFSDPPVLPEIEGLVIGGGSDVDPAYYEVIPQPEPADKAPCASSRPALLLSWVLAPFLLILRRCFSLSAAGVDSARDRFEKACLRHALQADLPVLGICRGAHFINIHCGGSLHSELSGFYGEAGNLATVSPRKRVAVEPGSRLRSIFGESAMVNSLHKQAVNRLGENIRCAARDEAGVIQAIEHEAHRFVLGVQWHPEYLPAMGDHQALFQKLVAAARSDIPET